MIVPALDSAHSLPVALASVAAQDYPNIAEVVVAAGDPLTAQAARGAGAVVVDNPTGTTPAGLNLAVAASTGEVIVRCDAHSELPPGYVTRAVKTLERSGADNVGGMQVPIGLSIRERAIAAAMSSPFGAGNARYRIGGEEGPTETVYLGVFRRRALERLGGYDEAFLRTQDYELNHRIIASGGSVWFDPELKAFYRPRGSLRALARQYYLYGKAKRLFARKHGGGLQPRQLAAPVLMIGLVASLLASIFEPRFLAAPAFYLVFLLLGGAASVRRAGLAALAVPAALAAMHLSWGWGFLRQGAVPGKNLGVGPDETRSNVGRPGPG